MGTSWAPISDTSLNLGEATERDRSLWNLANASNPSSIRHQHMKETTSPDDLAILPGDMDLLPQEIQDGYDEWELIDSPS